MRKSFFTVDFQNKETKTESSRPGLRSGVSVCQKGCEAPRTRTALKGLPQSEARDAKRGGPPKRVRSTEDEHAAQRKRSPKPATPPTGGGAGRIKGCAAPRTSTPRKGSAVRSPRREAGRAAKKGAKHRGRARRAAAAQSEARDAKRGRPQKRVRSTEDEHAAQRKRSPKPATQSGAGRKKGAKHRGRARRAAEAQSEACDAKRGRPQKGCEAPRTRTALKGLPQSEARDAKRGGPPKRVRSTEDEHAAQRKRSPKPATQSGAGRKKIEARAEDSPERATAVRSPRRKAGRAAKKGAKHRGRARRAAAAQSEACDAKRGRPPKRVRSP